MTTPILADLLHKYETAAAEPPSRGRRLRAWTRRQAREWRGDFAVFAKRRLLLSVACGNSAAILVCTLMGIYLLATFAIGLMVAGFGVAVLARDNEKLRERLDDIEKKISECR